MLHRKAKLKHVLTAGAVALALTVSPISAYAAEYNSDVLAETDSLLSIELSESTPSAIAEKRVESLKVLGVIKSKLGFDLVDSKTVNISAVGSLVSPSNMSSLVIASSKQTNYQKAKVIIDGKTMKFTQQDAIVKNGATLVPMREVFNNLNATVSWNQATKTVTAVKGSTKITLTIGSKTAYIGSTKVTLTQTPEVINGATLVPLRFVSEALGAKVNWNQQTSTVTITSAKEQAPSGNTGGTQSEVVSGIKVKHGKHTYESENQAQYDKVMEIVENNLKGYKDKPWYKNSTLYKSSADFQQGVNDYLINDTVVPFDSSNISDYFLGNKELVYATKDLVSNGVTKQEAVEVVTIWKIATNSMKEDSAPTSNNTTIRSAHDALVKGLIDCDSWSNAVIAHFDSAGYSTSIMSYDGHADAFVKINGSWYHLNAGIHYIGKTLPSHMNTYTAPTF